MTAPIVASESDGLRLVINYVIQSLAALRIEWVFLYPLSNEGLRCRYLAFGQLRTQGFKNIGRLGMFFYTRNRRPLVSFNKILLDAFTVSVDGRQAKFSGGITLLG